jgi:hypothetical protein
MHSIAMQLLFTTLRAAEPLVSHRAVADTSGIFGEDLFELATFNVFSHSSSEFRSRRTCRAAQGHHASGGSPGRPFLPLASFGRAKEGNQLPVCHRENQPRGCPPEKNACAAGAGE